MEPPWIFRMQYCFRYNWTHHRWFRQWVVREVLVWTIALATVAGLGWLALAMTT